MQTILITGGTGLVGRAMAKMYAAHGYNVIVTGRKASAVVEGARYVQWDVKKGSINAAAIIDTDYIINLAGAAVMDHKWTEAYKKEIQDSRTESGRLIIQALKEMPNKVKAVVNASANGWYGPDKLPPVPFTETDPADTSFLGETCRLWEESIHPVTTLGKRLVILRIGIVLSNDGGALAEFKKPLRFGVSGIMGNGKQVVSWVHIQDLCRMFLFAIENESCQGVYNAVAPGPVTSRELMKQLAKAMHKWFIPLPVPAFLLRLMLGGRSIEILKSTTVSSKKIKAMGFEFDYPDISKALDQLVG